MRSSRRFLPAVRFVPTLLLLLAAFPPDRASADETPMQITVESRRHAFYRGEEAALVVHCQNRSQESVDHAQLRVELEGTSITTSFDIGSIPAGGSWAGTVRLATGALRTGAYVVKATLTNQRGAESTATSPLTVCRRPNRNRLMVWLWGGGGDAWYARHGFTSWHGPGWRRAAPQHVAATRRALDEAMLNGADVNISPNGGLRDLSDAELADPDARYIGLKEWYRKRIADGTVKPLPNPFHPRVAELQDAANWQLMHLVKDYPQVRTAFFNTEVVDTMDVNRNEAGLRLMQERLGFDPQAIGEPKLVAPGVLADDDPAYLYRKYAYQHGKGITVANERTARMIRRFRRDILSISDPYREAALLDLYPGLDVIETWTYTNPDPKLMLYVETLRAACKPTGQIPLNVVTLLNYPGQLDPTDQWMLMGPGRTTVTSWINLSRAPKIVGYYYSSECQPKETDSYKIPYATSQAIQHLANRVYKPYGPMITRLDVAPRRIAVLSSEAARTHGQSPRLLGGYHNMQIYHFYTVLAMAHLQADVVLDETIERFGLDEYDVLVLPKCDVLTKKVHDEIMRFRDRGGTVIADQYLGAEIPGVTRFDFDFTYRRRVTARAIAENKAYAKWNDQLEPGSAELQTVKGVTARDDQKIMESYAGRLKTALRGKVDPAIDCDAPTVLLNTLTKEDVRYLFVINDRRTYDDRVGKYKAVLGKLLPQTAKIVLRDQTHPNLFAYDLLDRRRLPVEVADGEFRFTVELTELGGKIIALYPAPIGPPRIEAAGTMTAGLSYPLRVVLNDTDGNPLPGLQPVQITVTSPSGKQHDASGYYCATRGSLDLQLAMAINDEPGAWKISVLDLTAGGKVDQTFDLVAEPQHAAPPITLHTGKTT